MSVSTRTDCGQRPASAKTVSLAAHVLNHSRDLLDVRIQGQDYAELCVTSNFTFLTGASHPEELVVRAAELGLSAIAITDRNSLAGVVRAWKVLKELRRDTGGALKIRSQHRVPGLA